MVVDQNSVMDQTSAPVSDDMYVFPASFGQQRLFLLDQVHPGLSAYNLPVPLRIKGGLNLEVLEATLNEIIRRHETLRTTIGIRDGEVVQCIAPMTDRKMRVIDLQSLPHEDREARALALGSEEVRQIFDLSNGPLFKASICVIDSNDHLLVLNMHHIIADGWSHTVLLEELGELYSAFLAGLPSPLPPLPIQYADFAVWQREHLKGPVLAEQLSYWKHRLANAPFQTQISRSHGRANQELCRGAIVTEVLPLELTESLRSLSRQEGVTPVMLYFTVFNILLHRYTGQRDITVGSPIANRSLIETERLIGFFANSIVLRTEVSRGQTFKEMLYSVRDALLSDYEHQDLPFERLVQELQPERTINQNPLFQVMFFMQRAFIRPPAIPGLSMSHEHLYRAGAPVDLSIHLVEKDERIRCMFEYDTALFDRNTVTRMLVHYQNLLQSVIRNPDCKVDDLTMVSEKERDQVVYDWNQTDTDYPCDCLVSDLITNQAKRLPLKVAIRSADASLTYAELDRNADKLARWLRNQGVKNGASVAVCMHRSPQMVVALLGILKCGASYVPLDPDYPPARIQFMMEDASPILVLSETGAASALREDGARIVLLDSLWGDIDNVSDSCPEREAHAPDLAYVIYTSGSTGRPKGVEVTHRSLINLLWSMKRDPGFQETDIMLSVTTLAFDIAGLELFLPLVSGGCVELVNREVAADGERLIQVLERSGATIMQATPTTWRLMLQAGWKGKKGFKILCGGEAMPKELAVALCQRSGFVWNLYGPTETTIWSSIWKVEISEEPILIGRPISNTKMYILSESLEPVPMGVAGDLYIGGVGVARGYRNLDELTAQKFLVDPFVDGRMYKTGDRAKWNAAGQIEYLGRSDAQIKLRGFRIEIGEVEAVILEDRSIGQCVVALGNAPQESKRLIAYLVAAKGMTIDTSGLRVRLRMKLSEYMIPSAFVLLDKFPLTDNGKIDRKSLPEPSVETIEMGYSPPRDTLEMQLCKLWEAILCVQPIGITNTFFELGGHSLIAVRLFQQIEKLTGKALPLVTLFQAPTIAQLAEVLRKDGWIAPWSHVVQITAGGKGAPIFLVHPVGGNIILFNDLARHLGRFRPVYGVQAVGLGGNEPLLTSVEEIAARYVVEIRQVQAHGPYSLAGTSAGGIFAFEIARQIEKSGKHVAVLAMFDTLASGMIPTLSIFTRVKNRLRGVFERMHFLMRHLILAESKTDYFRKKLHTLKGRLTRRLFSIGFYWFKKSEMDIPKRLIDVAKTNRLAVKYYSIGQYSGRIVLFRTIHRPVGLFPAEDYGWSEHAGGGVEIYKVPGDHISMLKDPHAAVVASILNDVLDRETGKR